MLSCLIDNLWLCSVGPLCNSPVAVPLGQDPNIRMEQHINSECSVMTGKRQTKSAPVCARGKCGKVLFAFISCKVRILFYPVYILMY